MIRAFCYFDMKQYDKTKDEFYIDSVKTCGVTIRNLFLDDFYCDQKMISFEGTSDQIAMIKTLTFVDRVREMGVAHAAHAILDREQT